MIGIYLRGNLGLYSNDFAAFSKTVAKSSYCKSCYSQNSILLFIRKPRGKIYYKIFQEHDILRDLKISPFLSAMKQEKGGYFKFFQKSVLETCSDIFFTLSH